MIDRGEKENMEELINKLRRSIDEANEIININNEFSAKWDRKFINDLPNAAFAVVESGYSEGKDKRARHLPHHTGGVKSATENSTVDLPHYRAALTRANQIKSVLGKESDSSLRKKAASHLEKHRAVLKMSKAYFNPIELSIWEECEVLYATNIEPLLSNTILEEDR